LIINSFLESSDISDKNKSNIIRLVDKLEYQNLKQKYITQLHKKEVKYNTIDVSEK